MRTEELIQILNNNLLDLQRRRDLAYMAGNLSEVLSIDAEIADTRTSLAKLQE